MNLKRKKNLRADMIFFMRSVQAKIEERKIKGKKIESTLNQI